MKLKNKLLFKQYNENKIRYDFQKACLTTCVGIKQAYKISKS